MNIMIWDTFQEENNKILLVTAVSCYPQIIKFHQC